MITLICTDNKTIESILTIGKEYDSNEMESFDNVIAEFYYVTCDNGEYEAISKDCFTIKT